MLMCLNPIVKIPLDTLQRLRVHSKTLKQYNNYNHLSNQDKSILAKFQVLNKCDFFGCKKCNLCLYYKRYDWVKRAVNEWLNWKYHYFITLTFDEEHYKDFWFKKKFFSDWIKKKLKPAIKKLTYLASQEFGEHTLRKHYHVLLFTNYEFSDMEYIKKSKRNNNIYTSAELNKLWKYGSMNQINLISSLAEIKYVCSYSIKEFRQSKFNKLIPPDKEGEKLIIARGFGDKLNYESNIEAIPRSLIKNSSQRLYVAMKKLKRKEITPEDYDKIFKKEQPIQHLKSKMKKDTWSIEAYNQLLTQQLTKRLTEIKRKTEI